jgi:hypothetical protein
MAQSDQGHKGLLELALISFFFFRGNFERDEVKDKKAYGPFCLKLEQGNRPGTEVYLVTASL